MKIFAVGMNYAEHNKSLNETLSTKEGPVIFTKADSALLKDKKPFFIPDDLGTIEYETELVVRICRLGKTISERFAHRYYDAVTVGIDFTARELQQKLRAQGLPWDLCKGFDGSAALGEWVSRINSLMYNDSASTLISMDRRFRKDVQLICYTK